MSNQLPSQGASQLLDVTLLPLKNAHYEFKLLNNNKVVQVIWCLNSLWYPIDFPSHANVLGTDAYGPTPDMTWETPKVRTCNKRSVVGSIMVTRAESENLQ
ncbi:MAG: hypothetical protein KTR25_09810 [Myxococcales bacterium]|nr:hypothetical protein [Myxococcales bacterium]